MIRPPISFAARLASGKFANRPDVTALQPGWHRCRAWWAQRSVREQVLLGVLAVTAAITLFMLAIITPLRAMRQNAYDELHIAALLDAHLRAGETGSANSASPAATRHGAPSAILTDSAVAARLTIERIEPEGSNTRIVLGDAPFDQVIGWIANVEQTSRLRVEQAQIERKGGPGIVRATFVVTG